MLSQSPSYLSEYTIRASAWEIEPYRVPPQLQELGYDKVSSRTGWLLFAFSVGMIAFTPPISWFSERYHARRWPLLLGLLVLLGAQALFMESDRFWMMILARTIQGISSSVVWVVALALLCDTVPEHILGRQLGIALTGYSLGLIIATPIGGLLYGQLGYRAPFIFGMICTAIDLIGRLIVLEKGDVEQWRLAELAAQTQEVPGTSHEEHKAEKNATGPQEHASQPVESLVSGEEPRLSEMQVLKRLLMSFRPVVVLLLSFVWGLYFTALEPTLPLRAQDVWHLNTTKVGILFLAATIPSLVSGPITGILTDRTSPGLVSACCILLSMPWFYPFALKGYLSVFVVSLVFSMFFASGVLTPITAELAAVARNTPGMGYAHTYGAFNMAYAFGNALGPIIGGQIYDGNTNGWVILCGVLVGVLALGFVLTLFLGEPANRLASRQFWQEKRWKGRRQPRRAESSTGDSARASEIA